MVEVLAAYSHSTQAADLRLCPTVVSDRPLCPETERRESVEPARPLDERDITELIIAYREGATAVSLAHVLRAVVLLV
jgi:hypothetical protein